MRRLSAWLLVTLLVPACASPPDKEINQAQGAIDAAHAAGADRYAHDEYAAATTSLAQANDAVTQRDYRLALSHALESREHAQNAAREAADTHARVRGEVERTMAEVSALLVQADARYAAAEQARVPRRTLDDVQQQLAHVREDVQKADAAIQADDYPAAQPVLDGLRTRIAGILAALDAAPTSQSPRRPR